VDLGIPLLVAAIILFAIGLYLRRLRSKRDEAMATLKADSPDQDVDLDVTHPRPSVAEMHVRGEEARVSFDVPVPDGEDEVLSELLLHEAIEVVREKRHTLPMDGVRHVVALAGRGGNVREMGRATLETPGELPPRSAVPSLLNLSHIASDPLAADLDEGPGDVPGTVAPSREDDLAPVGQEIRLPKAVETGLRAQGIDPKQMSAGEMIVGMLSLVGYQVSPGTAELTHQAVKGGHKTFIREDRYQPGDHPEVDSEMIRRFLIEFQTSGADRGLLVSDKYGPFEIYEKERREPRVRFVTRERLQKMVDALALG